MNYRQFAAANGVPKNGTVALVAAGTANDIIAARTSYQFYMQRLVYVPTTVSAQAITVRSKTTTTAIYALIPASQALPYPIEFGEEGVPVTAGETLEMVNSAGPAGIMHVVGYYKLSSVQGAHASNQ